MAILSGTAKPWLRMRVFPLHEIASANSLQPAFRLYHYIDSSRRNYNRDPGMRTFSISAGAAAPGNSMVRVRFAPSPTGNLHVGGARTALFNYLFVRSRGGKFILRIEDTDLDRSTKESEEALLRDLSWLGLNWDEGPGVGGSYGPYWQSERNPLYKQYADKLLESGHAYLCFCSNEELEKMKQIAKLEQLPPVYTGKWANATRDEVEEALAKGTPFTYRFRVPKEGTLKINDLIRGEVRNSWNFLFLAVSFLTLFGFLEDFFFCLGHLWKLDCRLVYKSYEKKKDKGYNFLYLCLRLYMSRKGATLNNNYRE